MKILFVGLLVLGSISCYSASKKCEVSIDMVSIAAQAYTTMESMVLDQADVAHLDDLNGDDFKDVALAKRHLDNAVKNTKKVCR